MRLSKHCLFKLCIGEAVSFKVCRLGIGLGGMLWNDEMESLSFSLFLDVWLGFS
jgi:hypothetical protein